MPERAVAAFAYHDVTDDPPDSGFRGPGALPFKLGWSAFRQHLDAMAGASIAPQLVTSVDLTAPGRSLLLTFDDGGTSALQVGDELCRRGWRSEEHTSELKSHSDLVCRLLLEKKK